MASQVSVENKAGEIKLIGLTDELRELLKATRLLAVFDTFANEAEAIQSFADRDSSVEKAALSFA